MKALRDPIIDRFGLWARISFAIREWREDRQALALLRPFVTGESDLAAFEGANAALLMQGRVSGLDSLVEFLESFANSAEQTAAFKVDHKTISVITPPQMRAITLSALGRWEMLLAQAASARRVVGQYREYELKVKIGGQSKAIFLRRRVVTDKDLLKAINSIVDKPTPAPSLDTPKDFTIFAFTKISVAQESAQLSKI